MEINKTTLVVVLVLSTLVMLLYQMPPCSALGGGPEATVVVIDAETGEPIEGAVAIAIWRKGSSDRTWFEGASEKASRIEEAVSDKGGRILIDDFWDFQLLPAWKPHLTVYKPGYICWDQEYLFPSWDKRTDFDKGHQAVKMEKWKEGYSYNDHETFVGSCTRSEYHEAKNQLFLKSFDYETKLRINERIEKRQNDKK